MSAFYNENDPKAASWLRELIRHGHIAPGVVDERSVVDLVPADLGGFGQCHFFAGIGAWSHALRAAGWDDDRPVWTASLPCQPFSAAGARGGFADERHLWPVFFDLLVRGKPRSVPVLGEQVANRGGLEWLDLVSADMEGAGYAVGAVDTCAAGFGAPHLRQRLYWLASTVDHAPDARRESARQRDGGSSLLTARPEQSSAAGGLADADGDDGKRVAGCGARPGEAEGGRPFGGTAGCRDAGGLADVTQQRPEPGHGGCDCRGGLVVAGAAPGRHGSDDGAAGLPRPVNGHWRDADWLLCRDNKWRPVEPGTFPLAHGSAARVGRLRGYGNSLCAPQVAAFVRSAIDALW